MSSSGTADRPHGLAAGLARTVVAGRGWRDFAGPLAFLLAVTIAVVVVRSTRESESTKPRPAPSQVSKAKTGAAATRRFYTVAAGDTLAGIAAKTGVPLARIRALNPRVTPTALFVAQRIRVE